MVRIVGIDEVGRGCWAGPLVAAAVLWDNTAALTEATASRPLQLRDSKKLSRRQRETAYPIILSRAVTYGVGWVFPDEIDQVGLSASVRLAMQRALRVLHIVPCCYDQIIIDGNINYLNGDDITQPDRTIAVIKADDTVPAVSAASVIAKVTRDAYMYEAAKKYPQYGFDRHVGYGTETHRQALQAYGITDLHRVSYAPIRRLLDTQNDKGGMSC